MALCFPIPLKKSHSQVSDRSCFIKCTKYTFEVEFILAFIADAQAVLRVYCLHVSQITFCHIVGHTSSGFILYGCLQC